MPHTTKILAATAGVAAATGIAVAASKKLIDSRRTNGHLNGSSPAVVLHVRVGDEGRWFVESEGAEILENQHSTKGRAVRAARQLARGQKPSKLVIHRGDGAVQREHAYYRRA